MAEKVIFNKVVYNKNQFEQVVNNQFTQLVPQLTSSVAQTIDVNQFFDAYNLLFYQIPKFGEINSHEYLVKRSSDYIGDVAINGDIQALINEIDVLRQENLDLQQQLINFTTTGSI